VHDLQDLRKVLFEALESVSKGDITDVKKMQLIIDKGQAVAKISDTIIKSVKIELDFMKHMETPFPLTQFVPSVGQGVYSPGYSAKLAAAKRSVWAANNPDKMRFLMGQPNQGGEDMEKTA